MSDHWEFYQKEGDQGTFVFYDHGVRAELKDFPSQISVKARIEFKDPYSNGLPKGSEASMLNSLEDHLSSMIDLYGGIYIGRISRDGCRIFCAYCELGISEANYLCSEIERRHGYAVTLTETSDPARDTYWKELAPNDHEWRTILDDRVIEKLKGHNDDLEAKRRIDHWIYFPTSDSRKKFQEWVLGEDFMLENTSDNNDSIRPFGIQIYHQASPNRISEYTNLLSDEAAEQNGDYDGWETQIIRKKDT